MTENAQEDWYYRTTPVEGAPGWELTELNRPPNVEVGMSVSSTARQRRTRVSDIDIDTQFNEFCVSVEADYEGTACGRIPIQAMIAMFRAMGYTITPPGETR